MLAPDTLTRPGAAEATQSQAAAGANAPLGLAAALAALHIENKSDWAWDNYKRVVHDLCIALKAHRILEVGGGRDPLFTPAEIEELGVEMTVNDISPKELAVLPPGYNTACFDIAGDLSGVGHLLNTQDLAFSRMVFEHVADGQRAWANLYEVLAPGGVAMAFIPTFYSVPFVLNWLLPDALAAAIVKRMFAHRTDEDDPVFPARYSWCFATEGTMRPMLSKIGYREIAILPFYGHNYYVRFPLVRDVHKWFSGLAQSSDMRPLASYAYIVARK
ncbi:MAG TPA: methyltransferase domain-containing protein [Pseudolabrys sp.]|nr:methyltransferase domain-containing protein [Pseudolabrys sp.]